MDTHICASIAAFFKDVFQESGKWSLSRFSSGLIVLATLAWITVLVIKTHVLPDLEGPAFFVGGGAAHYGIGKWFDKKNDPTNPSANGTS